MGTCPLTVKGVHSREQVPTVTAGVILADYSLFSHRRVSKEYFKLNRKENAGRQTGIDLKTHQKMSLLSNHKDVALGHSWWARG